MGSTGITYRAALRITLRRTSAAYGYTLTIATTVAALTTTRGKPAAVELFLFVIGGIAAFAALDGCLQAFPIEEDEAPEHAFPFAGALNFISVTALGAATVLSHGIHSALAWLLAPMAATATYMLLVALQVSAVTRFRR